jgi:outer membrane protein TolC
VCAADGPVTLREAINLALADNHLLKAAQYEKRAAGELVTAGLSRYFPRLSLQSGAALSNSPSRVFMMKLDEARIDPGTDFAANPLNNPSARGDFFTSVSVEQPLVDFSIGTGLLLAGKEGELRESVLQQKQEEIAFKVFQAYLEIRRARAYETIAGQAVADAHEHQRLAEVRSSNGVGLKSDELRARTASAEAEGQLIKARNDLLLAKMRLNNAVGGKAGGVLDIVDETRQPQLALAENDLIQLGLASRGDLQVAGKEVEKAGLGVKSAENAYLPTVYASAAYQINDRDLPLGMDKDAWTIGLNLRWELFDGFRRQAEKNSALAMKSAADENLENYRNEVILQIQESYLRRDEVGKRLEVAGNARQYAEESVRLIGKRFENSIATMVELLDAQAALDKARANLVEVENLYALATARIYYSAGIFLREVLK